MTDPATYDRLIRRTAAQHQLDPALIKAVMHIESAFNPHAVSDKGAQGLMQVMPETGQRYGAEDLSDPQQNVRAAALYLKDLQKLFKNNMKLVLAAYNAGERMLRTVSRDGGLATEDPSNSRRLRATLRFAAPPYPGVAHSSRCVVRGGGGFPSRRQIFEFRVLDVLEIPCVSDGSPRRGERAGITPRFTFPVRSHARHDANLTNARETFWYLASYAPAHPTQNPQATDASAGGMGTPGTGTWSEANTV